MSLSRLIGRGVIAGLAAGSLLLAAQTAQALPVTSGLVAYWSGDDNADDGSGNGHHGSLVGGAGYGAGQFGQAFEFTGGGQSVTVPDSNDFHFAGNFTINLWAQIHDGPSGSVGGPDTVFIGQDVGSGYQDKWVFVRGGGKLSFHINGPQAGGSEFLALADFTPGASEWHNLTVRRVGNDYGIFIDGLLAASQTSGLNFPNVAAALLIGHAEGFQTDGLIDEVAIFDRALTSEEIAALAQAGSAVPEPGSGFLLAMALAGLLRRRHSAVIPR